MLSDREHRSERRGWSRREAKLRRAFDKKGSYLGSRIYELTSTLETNAQHIERLQSALATQQLASLLAPLPPLPVDVEDGEEEEDDDDAWIDGEGENWEDKISPAQTNRLWYQAFSTLQVLKVELDRDHQQLALVQQAKELSDLDLPTADAVKQAEAARFDLLDKASRIRYESSLLRIGAKVLSAGSRAYATSTILQWLRDFRKLGGFKRDSRGVHERDWIMSEEDLQHELLTWMRGQKRVTVKQVNDYINGFLFANEIGDMSRLLAYQVTMPVSMSTTLAWMKALGCKHERFKPTYYTDTHENPKVVEYRGEYIEAKRKHALRQALWCRVRRADLSEAEVARLDGIKAESPEGDFHAEVYDCVLDGEDYIEFHVDFLRDNGSVDTFDALRGALGPEGGCYSVRFDAAAAAACEYYHAPDVCKCTRKVRHSGQDESVYKAYAREGKEWVVRGVRGLRKKTEGPGEMVSAWQDGRYGFGVPMTAELLAEFNAWRKERGKEPLERSPGLEFLDYGKNKDGYWGYAHMEKQLLNVLDAYEFLDPDMQVVMEIDHSSGHAKQREDGLHVSNMNVKYGGKQRVLRDSIMIEGCLGPEEAKMYFADGKWSTEFSEGATCVDLKLKIGDTQTSTFAVGAPPPFYDWDAPRENTVVKSKRSRKACEGEGISPSGDGEDAAAGAAPAPREKMKEGYERKAEGVKQYLWERGWWKAGMSSAAKVSDDKNVNKVLQALPDFKNEGTALQHIVESRGHILLLSPKCHPEVAGVGIEYSWGFSKQKFRRVYNDEVPKHLHANIAKSMCTEKHLTIGRVRRFARRTRDYCRAYRDLALRGVVAKSKDMIEKMRNRQKAHRNILDMEIGFLGTQ